jgi:hypothetical protein
MLIKGINHKTVFLLGAGATRGAIDHVVINQKRLKPPLNSDFFKVADTYARASGIGSEDAKRIDRLRRIFKDIIPIKGDPSMEEAFSLLYIAKDFPEIYNAGRGRKKASGTQREIEDFLKLTFSILTAIDKLAPADNGYKRLVKKLGPTDTVISLNYDTALDSALAHYGWDPKIGYALGGGRRKVEWKPACGDEKLDIEGIRLLKLHGSVNWYVRGSYADLSKVLTSKPVFVSGPRKNEVRQHIRQIIPPIYGKFFGHNHWENLWKKAFKELCEAELIVVIGCSLVDTDFHLRALLSRVVKHRKGKNAAFQNAFFVAGTKTRRKWQKVLKGSYKRTIGYPNFEQFLRKELKA